MSLKKQHSQIRLPVRAMNVYTDSFWLFQTVQNIYKPEQTPSGKIMYE